MNEYRIVLRQKDDPSTMETVRVKCNNLQCAIEKAVVLVMQKTRRKGWRYHTHRLEKRAWDDPLNVSAALRQREIARRMAMHGGV